MKIFFLCTLVSLSLSCVTQPPVVQTSVMPTPVMQYQAAPGIRLDEECVRVYGVLITLGTLRDGGMRKDYLIAQGIRGETPEVSRLLIEGVYALSDVTPQVIGLFGYENCVQLKQGKRS